MSLNGPGIAIFILLFQYPVFLKVVTEGYRRQQWEGAIELYSRQQKGAYRIIQTTTMGR